MCGCWRRVYRSGRRSGTGFPGPLNGRPADRAGAFEGGVNTGQQPSESFADAGGFASEVVAETDQHTENANTTPDHAGAGGFGPGLTQMAKAAPHIRNPEALGDR